jgi:hypothetical protein
MMMLENDKPLKNKHTQAFYIFDYVCGVTLMV